MLLPRSYLVPIGKISLSEQVRQRTIAVNQAKQMLVERKIVQASGAITARNADYPFDFVPAATRGALPGFPMSGWMTAPLVLPAANYSVFADNTGAALVPQVPNNQAWVFYGVHVLTLNDPVTQLFFLSGAQSQDRWAQFDLEVLYDCLETQGYFSEPVVYGPQEFATVQVRARLATGVGCRVALDTIIAEPR